MAKPRLIILIRHAQSEGNKNRDIHQTIPDHRVKLTQDGWAQAHEAGRRLRKLLRPDDTLHFFTSPYRRTRETTEGILSTLTSDDPEPSPYRRSSIKVYEEPRLREQDFGNFQPCSAEMERMWQERADYGHFFYRIPNGESAADAYDRVSGFNESLWRQFGEDDFASVCVLVTHGLMSRVFLMKWYHFSVEYFEDLRNVNHCEFLIMRKQDNSKYLLENNLRTWSELRREREEQQLKEKEKDAEGKADKADKTDKADKGTKDDVKLAQTKSFVVTRRWGGCPNGCNHAAHYESHRAPENLPQQVDKTTPGSSGTNLAIRRLQRHKSTNGSDEGDADGEESSKEIPREKKKKVHIDLARAIDGTVSSPDGTPSFITAEDRIRHIKATHLHVGRDGGGTYSGHPSIAGSDSDASDVETTRRRMGSIDSRTHPGTGLANRLGDEPEPHNTAADPKLEDLDEAEKEDRSIRGSVY
ncbi:phosphoglycerate mutase [Trichoderma gamsii]|uniref:Phosphoglycerate mutase n=1 Tax=Trichoderma gamsii TaxID=398673 RepID=A0A2P4Z839_9HYPO|nr:phosphoglycerate mutase [Trichoderma gamsii]PON20441.1 phosphoglycerate mutase [Trichoderma gamsii]